MINYKQILEAVNRGIQLALDDFDDEEQVQNIKSKQVQNRDYTKEYLDLLKYEAVDLGLPSGTLWCKYNLGVDSNQLLISKDWFGKYYAWGELKPNKTKKKEIYFDWSNYKYGKSFNKLTKYCNNPEYGLNGFSDNLIELLPEDDVAYQNKKFYNFKFSIPTREQIKELIKYTNNYWVNNYDPNKLVHNPEDDGGIQGLDGQIFEGKNKNQLFIPAAGYYYYNGLINSGGYIWTNTINSKSAYAYDLCFDCGGFYVGFHNRFYGFPIRPVINL